MLTSHKYAPLVSFPQLDVQISKAGQNDWLWSSCISPAAMLCPVVHLQAVARDLCRMTGLPDNTKLELYKEVKGRPVVVERIDETWVLLGDVSDSFDRCKTSLLLLATTCAKGHFHLPTWWYGLLTSLCLQEGHGHGQATGR
jgi:hypothetical protein